MIRISVSRQWVRRPQVYRCPLVYHTTSAPPATGSPIYKVPGPQVPRRQVSTPSSRLTALKPYKFKKEFPTTQHQRRGITGTTPTPRHRRRKTTYATPSGTTPTPRKGAPTSATQTVNLRRRGSPQHGMPSPTRWTPRGQNSIICSTEGTVLQMVASRADIGK